MASGAGQVLGRTVVSDRCLCYKPLSLLQNGFPSGAYAYRSGHIPLLLA